MSLLRRIANAFTTERPVTNMTHPGIGAGRTRAGVTVTVDRAMRHTAVWACIRLRAETIGSTPVGPVRRVGNTRSPVPSPPWMLKPNAETTRFELFERTAASLDADGNGFWGLVWDRLGRLQEVWPLPPNEVEVLRDPRTSANPAPPKYFRFANEEWSTRDILHIPGFNPFGRLRAPSPIELEMSAVGLAIAAEEFGEAFFRNGAIMSGVITSKGPDPGETAVSRMRTSFARDHTGLSQAHLPGFLFGGAEWTQLTIPNNQAQFLETRKYQLDEIARIFRVPSHKINNLERATFSNIEHQGIEWVTDGLVPYSSRIEHAVEHAGLLGDDESLRFNFAGQLRGDTVSRFAAYAVARQWGWLSADDIRALEDMNPLPDGIGQSYLEPLNMVPAGERPDPDPVTVANVLRAAGLPASAITTLTSPPQEA
jgi:HK97 family phage portal protein